MPRARKGQGRHETRRPPERERATRTTLLLLALVCMLACSRHRDPQAVLDHVRQTLRHGDNTTGAAEAEKGYKEFHSVSAEWAWKFTVVRASLLYGRGMDEEALRVLASEPTAPPSGELAIRKLRLEGEAFASLHKFPEAEEKLGEAERLCAVSLYPGCADLVTARGELEMGRGHYAAAQALNVLWPWPARAATSFWKPMHY
jgi:hypothetical protein